MKMVEVDDKATGSDRREKECEMLAACGGFEVGA